MSSDSLCYIFLSGEKSSARPDSQIQSSPCCLVLHRTETDTRTCAYDLKSRGSGEEGGEVTEKKGCDEKPHGRIM